MQASGEQQLPPLFLDGPMIFYTIRKGPMPGIWSDYGDCKRVSEYFEGVRIERFTSYQQALAFFQGDASITVRPAEDCERCSKIASCGPKERLDANSTCTKCSKKTISRAVPYYYRAGRLPQHPDDLKHKIASMEEEAATDEQELCEADDDSDANEAVRGGYGGGGGHRYSAERYWDAGRKKQYVQFVDCAHIFKAYIRNEGQYSFEPAVQYPDGSQDVDCHRIDERQHELQRALKAPSSGCMIMLNAATVEHFVKKRKNALAAVPLQLKE